MASEVTQICVSTTFFPAAVLSEAGGQKPDVILRTTDSVYFYCHKTVLQTKSYNNFGQLLPDPTFLPSGSLPSAPESPPTPTHQTIWTTLFVVLPADAFNIVLHLIYGISFERYGPSITALTRALGCLPQLGLAIPDTSSEVWSILLRHAPTNPMAVYSTAAAYAMDSVCTLASQYTLTVPLAHLTTAEALAIGPVYLRRLMFLHLGQLDALKRILRQPPEFHEPVPACGATGRRWLTTSWMAVVTDLLLQDNPQTTTAGMLVSSFEPISRRTGCEACKESLRERIALVVQEWVTVKRTI